MHDGACDILESWGSLLGFRGTERPILHCAECQLSTPSSSTHHRERERERERESTGLSSLMSITMLQKYQAKRERTMLRRYHALAGLLVYDIFF
jgi:hypothetical protein